MYISSSGVFYSAQAHTVETPAESSRSLLCGPLSMAFKAGLVGGWGWGQPSRRQSRLRMWASRVGLSTQRCLQRWVAAPSPPGVDLDSPEARRALTLWWPKAEGRNKPALPPSSAKFVAEASPVGSQREDRSCAIKVVLMPPCSSPVKSWQGSSAGKFCGTTSHLCLSGLEQVLNKCELPFLLDPKGSLRGF